MKTICLVPTSEAPEWMQILLGEIDTKIVVNLSREDEKYVGLREKLNQLLRKYPKIFNLLDGEEGVTLDSEEQEAFHEYMLIRSEIENKERELFYQYGHLHYYEYMKRIGVLK